MHFFGKQRKSRANSHVLYLGFVLAMTLFMLVVHLGVNAFSMMLGETDTLFASSVQAKVMVGLIWFAVLSGCFFRYLDVRAGGPALARRFGADFASEDRRFSNDKVLHNVVSEMAIAASCEKPEVFVMRDQDSINAFVVGSIDESKPKALILTQGALDQLDREELQAVVAHEFGHIANGDIPLNMRMLVVLGGLLAIDEIGQILTPKETMHFGIFVGIPMRVLGSVGVLVATLIRSEFSRQREFLADASGAQYSRNPLALASALTKIRDEGDGCTLYSTHAAELAHLCFHARKPGWITRLFSSHPPIQKRIDEIDPYFSTKKRISEREQKLNDDGDVSLAWEQPVTREHFASASAALPDRVSLLIADTPSCLAALFAIFASDSPIKRDEYIEAISFAYSPLFAEQVKHTLDSMPVELEQNKPAILEHVTHRLRENVQKENRQRLVLNLERLLVVEGEFNLLNYASAQLVRRQLDVEFPVVEQLADKHGQCASRTNVKTFDEMSEDFALLLSLMVESSGARTEVLDAEFAKVLKFYTQQNHPRRVGSEPGLHKDLERAFQTLYVQPKPVRQAFVQHCVEIMHYDGHVASAEEALIDLFAASLDCDVIAA